MLTSLSLFTVSSFTVVECMVDIIMHLSGRLFLINGMDHLVKYFNGVCLYARYNYLFIESFNLLLAEISLLEVFEMTKNIHVA